MRTYLADISANEPVDKMNFPLQQNTSLCRFCNFYEIDREEIASAQAGPF